MSAALSGIPVRGWDQVLRRIGPVVPGALRRECTGDKVHKLAKLIGGSRNIEQVYDGLTSTRWADRGGVVLGAQPTRPKSQSAEIPEPIHRLMLRDLLGYLPDNILAKVDRASMSASLESRAPLLDHRRRGKWLLRQVLHKYVPKALVERPKMGFCVPIDHWLRGPLLGWASDVLNPDRLRSDGYLDAVQVGRKLAEHRSGERNWQHHLWRAAMFQTWLDAQ
jgi:asparagine synthase (glutamine-hydrolysing)